MAAIVALSLVPGDWRPSIGLAKGYEHFLAYFVVAAVLTTALRAGWPHIAALVVLAGMLEAAQGWIPGRDPNLVDFLGSSTGALLGFATRSIIMPRRRERFAAEAAGESANRAVPRCADVGVVIAVGAALTWISVSLAHDTAGLLGAALALVMLAIAVIDARYFLIPDPLNAAGFALGVAHSAVFAPDGDIVAAMAGAALRAAVLALVFLGLRFIYARVRGRQGIGLGDVKLAAVAGAWLDWQFMPIAVEIAALSALAVYVLRRHALRQPLRSDSRLPFGMYFAPAIWIGWLLQTALTRGW